MNDALAVCKAAIENNDPNSVSYYSLKLEPEFREAKKALIVKQVRFDPFTLVRFVLSISFDLNVGNR